MKKMIEMYSLAITVLNRWTTRHVFYMIKISKTVNDINDFYYQLCRDTKFKKFKSFELSDLKHFLYNSSQIK